MLHAPRDPRRRGGAAFPPPQIVPMFISLRPAALACAALGVLSPILAEEPRVLVTATRVPIPESDAPTAVTVIDVRELEARQIDSVADALRTVPGLDVVQTGTPGQLTSVFTRGLKSEHTQVLIDGVAINQGLGGAFNFADLTTTGLARIEVQRGPQSTLYGPRALAGAIQLFSARGEGAPREVVSLEGGSFGTFRERAAASGRLGEFDFLIAGSRLDTDNERPNNQYRAMSFLGNFGWTPKSVNGLRLGLLVTASRDDTGNPGVFVPGAPEFTKDNLLTKRWQLVPSVEWKPSAAVRLRLSVSYDREEQINDPNDIAFLMGAPNPTKAVFRRTQIDAQGDFELARWATLTAGGYFNTTRAEQYRPLFPFADSTGLPQIYIRDQTDDVAAFAQFSLRPVTNALIVLGGRVDHFNQFGTVFSGRVAGSYVIEQTGTTLRSSIGSGFAPPTPQDRIFRSNVSNVLDPERSLGFDAGFEQSIPSTHLRFGANFFFNRLSNVIGFDQNFDTFNLGRARTQGLEAFLRWEPLEGLTLNATYAYLDARRTGSAEISQPDGARLPRRARNTVTASANYRFAQKRAVVGTEVRHVNAREEANFGSANSDVPDYTVLRAFASWQATDRLKLNVRIENLTDRRYAEVPGYPNLRRGIYGGAEWRF